MGLMQWAHVWASHVWPLFLKACGTRKICPVEAHAQSVPMEPTFNPCGSHVDMLAGLGPFCMQIHMLYILIMTSQQRWISCLYSGDISLINLHSNIIYFIHRAPCNILKYNYMTKIFQILPILYRFCKEMHPGNYVEPGTCWKTQCNQLYLDD